ncbi:MAG: DUF1667 domain-containing protein [Eubacteriales bacterium]|nr:DUF1667 domain-containing protein [Eubacteriales bacterium]
MQQKEITCISCPMGCRMTVTLDNGEVTKVEGNTCKRGEVYARQECVSPMRMVTAVAPVKGSLMPVSLKTSTPIPKDKIKECMEEINRAEFSLPILLGDVLIKNIAGTGADIVATKDIV